MLKAFCLSFVEWEDDQNDKHSSDQEEKGAYEKEKGDTEEDKDAEENAMQVELGVSADQEEEEYDKMEGNHEVAFDEIIKWLSNLDMVVTYGRSQCTCFG